MNTENHPRPTNQVSDAAKEVSNKAGETYDALSSKVGEGVERTKEYAQHAVGATKDAAQRVSDSAKDMYQTASAKGEEILVSSNKYAHQNPIPVALGTLIVGLTLGYLVGLAQREELTFRQRLFR